MNLYDFYKEQYQKSLDGKNEINSSLSTPIGILTTLAGAFFYLVSNFGYFKQHFLTFAFIVLALGTFYLLGRCIFHIFKCLSDFHQGYEYAYLPDVEVIEQYHKDLKEYYNELDLFNTNDLADDFERYIITELVKNASINQKNNKSKLYERFNCYKYLIYTSVCLILLMVPYGINFVMDKNAEKTQNVKIINAVKVEQSSNLELKLKTTDMPKIDTPKPKPTPPASQLIREGVNPTKPQSGKKTATNYNR